MKRATTLAAAASLSATLALSHAPALAQTPNLPNAPPTPYIGETVEQFEARKRGVPVLKPKGNSTLVADQHGHFWAQPIINGQKIRALIDTGASFVALSRADAELIGVKVSSGDYKYKMSTANGITVAAPVRLEEVQIGDISLPNVTAVVLREGGPPVTLLGMSFLGRLSGFETSGGKLLLRQ